MVPNLVRAFEPAQGLMISSVALWRGGQPVGIGDWEELRDKLGDGPVTVVKLNDETEGTDAPGAQMGWELVKWPLAPFDDKPWTVFEIPSRIVVNQALESILAAYGAGRTVFWHCSHGKDRTGLVSALVGRALFGWNREQMWANMIEHGFRWELPGLDAYMLES